MQYHEYLEITKAYEDLLWAYSNFYLELPANSKSSNKVKYAKLYAQRWDDFQQACIHYKKLVTRKDILVGRKRIILPLQITKLKPKLE